VSVGQAERTFATVLDELMDELPLLRRPVAEPRPTLAQAALEPPYPKHDDHRCCTAHNVLHFCV
jgi:hypothetical protein